MAKFCGKCGARLDEQTGKCPNCDKEATKITVNSEDNIKEDPKPNTAQNDGGASGEKRSKKESKGPEKKGKAKKICITTIVILLVLLIAGAGTICLLVYHDKLDIPYVNDILVSIGLKDKGSDDAPIKDGDKVTDEGNKDLTTDDDGDDDLNTNYQVPAFDAETYFKENTTLKSSFDVKSSQSVNTEREAYTKFAERGFASGTITYEYTMDGTYSESSEISRSSSSRHPMYQTYYITASGDVWMVIEVNGSFFASPLSYNFADEEKVQVIISETDTITSYDSTTNKFYVNIPDQSQIVIKTVAKVDASTLEKLTAEEIDKL